MTTKTLILLSSGASVLLCIPSGVFIWTLLMALILAHNLGSECKKRSPTPSNCNQTTNYLEEHTMDNSQILANNTEGTHPICVYRYKEDHICLFYGYVNICMCMTCFAKLCQSIFAIHSQVEQGTIEASHITVNYGSTTLVLPADDFCLMSDSLASAQERLEFIEDCEIAGILPTQKECDDFPKECDDFSGIILPPLPQIHHNPQHIHLN